MAYPEDQILPHSPAFWSAIDSAKTILVNLHRQPDFDSICSALSLRQILIQAGKTVTIFSPDSLTREIHQYASLLPDLPEIQINDLTAFSPADYDLFIALDSAQTYRFSPRESVLSSSFNCLNIDHHAENPGYGKINIICPQASSTAEILYWLFHDLGKLDYRSAQYLYLGIYSDTEGFKWACTTPESMQAAADLASSFNLPQSELALTLHSTPSQYAVLIAQIAGKLQFLPGSQIGYLSFTLSDLQPAGLTPSDVAGLYFQLCSWISQLSDVRIGLVFYELAPGKIGISFRSNHPLKPVDVGAIARLIPGGGGHPRSAGAILTGTIDQAQAQVFALLHQHNSDLFTSLISS